MPSCCRCDLYTWRQWFDVQWAPNLWQQFPGWMIEGVSLILNCSFIPLSILINALKLLLFSLSSSLSTVALKGGIDGGNDCFGVIGWKAVASVCTMHFPGR